MNIFFDVDGVLIDGWHTKAALRKPWDINLQADLGVDRALFQSLFFTSPGEDVLPIMHQCVMGRRDLRDALDEVLPKVGYRGGTAEFMRYWFEKDANVNTEVLAAARQIRRQTGARLYLATGQEHHRAKYLWETLGFSRDFDDIFYSAQLGYLKKDVRFFVAINGSLGLEYASPPLFFDDQREIVDVAKSAGWNATVYDSILDIKRHPELRHVFA